ncbi:SUMO-specific isopeptidase USPL1 [Syngnathus acus]|uniref:SUMO-specific isopeptidase USPL1 n=1 Tax=Syngnathus acus TaxID=161584 RepID=UPI001885F89B|nr:SUMO-specific isopeptidase USPL1 [Syngnathus acus]
MVILLEWQRAAAAADLGRSGAVAMPGEDTGSGALASPPVGYLGKVQERAASLDQCPWCASKGRRSSLRLYRLNLHESVTLCVEPQCLFPLVGRPLEDVLSSLIPSETAAGNRTRKTLSNKDDCEEVKAKRLRSRQSYARSSLQNGHCSELSHLPQGCLPYQAPASGRECRPPEEEPSSSLNLTPPTDEDNGDLESSDRAPEGPGDAPKESIASPGEPVDARVEAVSSPGGCVDITAETGEESVDELVGAAGKAQSGTPGHLFWKNAHNLCWLDVLLVLLVNCQSLRRRKAQHEPQRAAIWRLMNGYDSVCRALPAESDGEARARCRADERLQSLRAAVFESLQPRLHCQLGQEESPVFALPLLLAADSWAEPLFRTTFRWEFECAECKTVTRERVTKTLTTFTELVPDWHPLRATHLGPCNACGARHQRRSMKLERVAAVLALHFVEGVPHSDVDALTFNLEGRTHTVTALIQYDQRAKHFVAWTRTPDGSWLEFDDLKHPQSALHAKLPVPAQEMHILFWEAEEDSAGSEACSPSSTRPDSPPSQSVVLDRDENASMVGDCSDVSIGSATLLSAFNGLSHDDIVTLTLTEVGADTLTDHQALLDCMPDSSEDPPQLIQSSDPTDKDPDYDPALKEAPRRSSRISKIKPKRDKKNAKTNTAPPQEANDRDSCPAQDGTLIQASRAPAEASDPPHQIVQRASPESSTGPPSPPLNYNSRWSFLISQHLANQKPSTSKPLPAPVPRVKSLPSHSTPTPARRPPAPKPQPLRTEDSDGHPLKAAETFGAFGAAVRSPPPSSPKKSWHSQSQTGSPTPRPLAILSDTEALRYKLLKKLKAKKKKLAKLNQLLARAPDSAAPFSISSSGTRTTALPADLPHPSPDSSGFLDVLACCQDGTPNTPQPPVQAENFLDELLSMTPVATEAQQAMEDETLRELELLLS